MLLCQRVAVASRHREPVSAAVLAAVCSVRRSPGLAIQRAVKALRNGVLGEDIGVEERLTLISRLLGCLGSLTYAGRIGTISVGVAAVVTSLSVASVGAGRGSVSLSLREREVLVA